MSVLAAIAVPHPPLIVPDVGSGQEKTIQNTVNAYNEAMQFLASYEPETVIVISPHAQINSKNFHISPGNKASGSFTNFFVPWVSMTVPYDEVLGKNISSAAKGNGIPTDLSPDRDPTLDYGVLVPLYFFKPLCPKFKIVRISLSGLSLEKHFAFGKSIAQATNDKRVVIIGSGDLSHKLLESGPYGFVPEGPELDNKITEIFADGDLKKLKDIDPVLIEKGAECGLRAFVMMAGALDERPYKSELLSYEGPFGVGYAVATFKPLG